MGPGERPALRAAHDPRPQPVAKQWGRGVTVGLVQGRPEPADHRRDRLPRSEPLGGEAFGLVEVFRVSHGDVVARHRADSLDGTGTSSANRAKHGPTTPRHRAVCITPYIRVDLAGTASLLPCGSLRPPPHPACGRGTMLESEMS